jgi:hypothetical protein
VAAAFAEVKIPTAYRTRSSSTVDQIIKSGVPGGAIARSSRRLGCVGTGQNQNQAVPWREYTVVASSIGAPHPHRAGGRRARTQHC